ALQELLGQTFLRGPVLHPRLQVRGLAVFGVGELDRLVVTEDQGAGGVHDQGGVPVLPVPGRFGVVDADEAVDVLHPLVPCAVGEVEASDVVRVRGEDPVGGEAAGVVVVHPRVRAGGSTVLGRVE